MRSIAVAAWVMLAACGGHTSSLRMGTLLLAPGGDRAFVTVERWASSTAPIHDADDEPIVERELVESWVIEVAVADGAQRLRAHRPGWLAPIAYRADGDVLTIAHPDDRRGDQLAIAGQLVTVPGGWPLRRSLPRTSADGTRLTGCEITGDAIVVATLELHGDGPAEVARTELPLPARPPLLGCTPRTDGAKLAVWSADAVDEYDLASGRPEPWQRAEGAVDTVLYAGSLLVVLRGDRSAIAFAPDGSTAAATAPGCCRTMIAVDAADAVVAADADRTGGLLIGSDGGTTPLTGEAALRFAEQTGLAPRKPTQATDRIAALPGGGLLIAAVEGGRPIVRISGGVRVTLLLDPPR